MHKHESVALLALATVALSVAGWPITVSAADSERTCFSYQVAPGDADRAHAESREETVAMIEGRLAAVGSVDHLVEWLDDETLIVELPAVPEAGLRRLINAAGIVTFSGHSSYDIEAGDVLRLGLVEEGRLFDAASIVDVQVGTGFEPDEPTVDLSLDPDAARLLDAWASQAFGGQFAAALDRVVLVAPVIQAQAFDGEMTISAGFSEAEAQGIVDVLRSGPLPISMEETSFGPCQ